MTDTERAWAAGFFDGEGHSRMQYGSPKVQVAQNHREVLDRFVEAVGEGKVYGPYGSRAMYHYNVSGFRRCRIVMGALWPYLSSVKKAQAMCFMEVLEDA